jgi:pimeloyl-ACP methyl ester carboxylesterase
MNGTWRFSASRMGKGVLGGTDPDDPSLRSLASNTMAAKYTRAAPPLSGPPDRATERPLPDGAHRSTFVDALLRIAPLRTALAASTFGNSLFTRKLIQLFVADRDRVTPYWVDLYQRPIDVKGTARAIGDWLPQLLAKHDASASSDPAAYSRLTMPALLIWGEQDTTTPLSLGQYLARIIPGSRLVPMPGIGHMPPIEDAEAFNRILLEFLAAHWAPAA